MYYNGKKVRNLYYNGKCITRLALGKEMTRLVEGDDFVRAEWLVGDGTAYIDTLHNLNEDLEIQTKCVLPTYGTYLFWYREVTTYQTMAVWNIITFDSGRLRFANSSTAARLTAEQSNTYEFNTYDSTLQINGVLYTVTKNPINRDFYLFQAELEERSMPEVRSDYTTNAVRCAYFRFINANGTTIQDLTPCRLLRPIPATLDANGIARNADECGMYNSVNGLFYGNVASSGGTFTVSDN